ncbi:30S ribosomal protein S3 [Candidatus Berkelbacteria bacterium RIFCSPHIGHO2_12_FULL_36_9]|uniref:Small ribosomal subunit protein uS3 n=1 Tax=Candidatus Berkelbacteria bacterium RIFCSPHIGHO2_12_FULL_36_9 TaxID=1797469 RepID=A0A1F5EDX1_9BACT|nr:MAG: 30S ribosomal protein S3 [Candidatus Berkelbacteria bacterium RIFCSPHIGHO2_12_FULL_36_9]
MGQKVNPISFRLINNKEWRSKWFSQREYADLLAEDIELRKGISEKLGRSGGVNKVEIERGNQETTINIHTAKPGIIIGRSGQGVNQLKEYLEKRILKTNFPIRGYISENNPAAKKPNHKIKINIMEIRNPEICASLVAQNICQQLEKRIAYRRAVKMAIEKMKVHKEVKGVKVSVAGRLGGAEIARKEKFSDGSIPLGTFRSQIDYAHHDAFTTYGVIGVKVWIYTI